MKLTLEMPDTLVEKVIKDIMGNFPEASQESSLECIHWHYPEDKPLSEWRFIFEDHGDHEDAESGPRRIEVDADKLLEAFPRIFSDLWPKGCAKPPTVWTEESWDSWVCQCDATDFDAFAQLVCLGDVIYG